MKTPGFIGQIGSSPLRLSLMKKEKLQKFNSGVA
jgi:hypothetical protein